MWLLVANISVVGVGKLGLCMAAAYASKGYNVIGVDINPKIIDMINGGVSPFYEPHLDELLVANKDRLKATADFRHAIQNSDITFIVVNTPSNKDGSYSIEYLSKAAESIGRALKEKEGYHIVVVTSTVLPGTTENAVRQILEKYSGKKYVSGFGLCYNPEFIALGSVIHDFQNPDFILIGESDEKSGDFLLNIYKAVCGNDVKISKMSIKNAELAKIALNSFITMKIAFANTLVEICQNMEGGNVDAITNAIGLDRRIGSKYLKGGLSFGGPCFPRDNRAFAYVAKELGCTAEIAKAVDKANRTHTEHIVELVTKYMSKGRIAVLGLAYKPNTNIVEASASLEIARELQQRGFDVSVYDPAAMEAAKDVLGNKVHYSNSMRGCISTANLCILATPWDEFKDLKPEDFDSNPNQVILLDGWRTLDRRRFDNSKVMYKAIGNNESLSGWKQAT